MKNLFIFCFLFLSMNASTRAEGVLFIGDSHVPGPFGVTLDTLLRTNSHLKVETYGVCAAIAGSFLNPFQTPCGYFYHLESSEPTTGLVALAPHLPDVLNQMKPDLTLIELGSNYAGYSDASIKADMTKLAKAVKAGGSKCILISMPDTRKFRAEQPRLLKDMQDATAGDCDFIDSTVLTHYPDVGGDGLHYQSTSAFKPIAVAWANSVYEKLKLFLPTP